MELWCLDMIPFCEIFQQKLAKCKPETETYLCPPTCFIPWFHQHLLLPLLRCLPNPVPIRVLRTCGVDSHNCEHGNIGQHDFFFWWRQDYQDEFSSCLCLKERDNRVIISCTEDVCVHPAGHSHMFSIGTPSFHKQFLFSVHTGLVLPNSEICFQIPSEQLFSPTECSIYLK